MTDWRGIPTEYQDAIVTGDARLLSGRIPDNSIDLIFTDPVYEHIEDYQWLAETAQRVLKPDSALLAYCGIGLLPQTHDALRAGGLSYRWRLITRPVFAMEFHGKLLVATQECLWYEKGHSVPRQSIFDFDMSTTKGQYDVRGGNWGKSPSITRRYIETFSPPNGVVLDLFSGSGTIPAECKQLGRRYVAFEIDPQTAQDARERVLMTQPPLFVMQDEQSIMELSA